MRRWIIRAEFMFGLVGCIVLGFLLVVVWHDSLGQVLLGLWLAGVGINYLPLAIHAVQLYPSGRLEAELAGVDIRADLRRYTMLQFWLFVPFALAIMDLRQRCALRRR